MNVSAYVGAGLDVQRLPEQPLERRRVSSRRPQLELGVSGRPKLEQRVLAAVM
jgi:hypothetical protein